MKRTALKRIGKRGKINIEANRKIAKMWQDLEQEMCEIQLHDCLLGWTLQNVHRHKRSWYYK